MKMTTQLKTKIPRYKSSAKSITEIYADPSIEYWEMESPTGTNMAFITLLCIPLFYEEYFSERNETNENDMDLILLRLLDKTTTIWHRLSKSVGEITEKEALVLCILFDFALTTDFFLSDYREVGFLVDTFGELCKKCDF
jgi:hypothetical protein